MKYKSIDDLLEITQREKRHDFGDVSQKSFAQRANFACFKQTHDLGEKACKHRLAV